MSVKDSLPREMRESYNKAELAALYAEFSAEDSELAEQGLDDFLQGLLTDDTPVVASNNLECLTENSQ